MNLIVDLQYFPPIILFESLNKFSNIVFEQCEYYQKMSFRNRCQIAGAEGVINLSVPLVKGRDQKAFIKDVRISDWQPWQVQHWKTIVSCYSRSPWFEFYRDDLEELYKKPFDFLLDWNWDCMNWALGALKMPVPVSLTREYRKEYDAKEWMDWRGKIVPKNRGRGWPAGAPGQNAGDGPLKYRQVFEERVGYIPNLSILDLLFCEGKRSAELLRS
jgi:hypothetical protein